MVLVAFCSACVVPLTILFPVLAICVIDFESLVAVEAICWERRNIIFYPVDQGA